MKVLQKILALVLFASAIVMFFSAGGFNISISLQKIYSLDPAGVSRLIMSAIAMLTTMIILSILYVIIISKKWQNLLIDVVIVVAIFFFIIPFSQKIGMDLYPTTPMGWDAIWIGIAIGCMKEGFDWWPSEKK